MKLFKVTKNERDKKRRKLFQKLEKKRRSLSLVISNMNLEDHIRYRASLKLAKLPKNSSEIRLKNRCIVTGRAKGISRFFKISRIQLREWACMGLLPGIRKASW